MTIQRVQASNPLNNNPGMTDLSIIGVPSAQQKNLPTVTGYPRKFSGEALPVWTKMLQDPVYKNEIRSEGDPDKVWHNTIIEFLKRCEAEGLVPFTGNTETTKNEYVFEFVNRSRIDLVAYFDEVGFFERVKIRKAYREYLRNDSMLTIQSWAELTPVKDMSFEKWLVQVPLPRFHKSVDNRYVRMIQPHIMAWVRYLNPARVTVGFDIQVAGTINIPGKKTPKRKEVDAFIDKTIWLPIVRAHKIDAIKNRLF